MVIPRPGAKALAAALAVLLVPVGVLAAAGRPAPPPSERAPVMARTGHLERRLTASRLRASRAAPRRLVFVARDGTRITAERVRRFLVVQGSPMARHAQAIVDAGVRSGVDPRVVIAIAGVETTFGTYTRRFNAWGWAGGRAGYPSWPEAIRRYTAALAATYPGMRFGDFSAGARRYAPPDPTRWASRCARYFRAI